MPARGIAGSQRRSLIPSTFWSVEGVPVFSREVVVRLALGNKRREKGAEQEENIASCTTSRDANCREGSFSWLGYWFRLGTPCVLSWQCFLQHGMGLA